jgi:hypothetical protein
MAMTVLSVAQLRRAITARIAALEGWRPSAQVLDRPGQDPASSAHLAFSVVARRSVPVEQRQRVGQLLTTTELVVRFTARVKPKDQGESLDEATDAEHLLINTLLPVQQGETYRLTWTSSERALEPQGDWIRVEVTFTAQHYL